MINLIPIEEKRKMKKDFLNRFLVVLFVVLGFSFFILTVAIFPTYLISYERNSSVKEKLEIQKNEAMPEIDKEAQVAVKSLNDKLNLIENAIKNKYVFSNKIVDEILLKKSPSIKITKIFYENNKEGGKSILISGIAQNREQLLFFRRAFEDSGVFKSVDLPVSNFIKGRNIQFNLSLDAF